MSEDTLTTIYHGTPDMNLRQGLVFRDGIWLYDKMLVEKRIFDHIDFSDSIVIAAAFGSLVLGRAKVGQLTIIEGRVENSRASALRLERGEPLPVNQVLIQNPHIDTKYIMAALNTPTFIEELPGMFNTFSPSDAYAFLRLSEKR